MRWCLASICLLMLKQQRDKPCEPNPFNPSHKTTVGNQISFAHNKVGVCSLQTNQATL